MATPIEISQVPGPRGLPIIGNARDIDMVHPYDTFVEMSKEYGSVYKLELPSGPRLMISDPDIVHEICDDAKFDKFIGPGLKVIQGSIAGPGLFTSETKDPGWEQAHAILMVPFSQQSMRNYMPRMQDIAGQLMDKWSRMNPDDDVDVPAGMTSVTLDTIALCGFDYRFNSLHRETPHPFVAALVRTLSISQARTTRPAALEPPAEA
jgi:cytochrome P450/NADPH-cytochrome P450 reductase